MVKNITTTYRWLAMNKSGNRIKGETVATNKEEVKTKILALGLTPKSISVHKPRLVKKKVQPADISVFSRQLSTMISAGAPIVQSLEIIAASEENQTFKSLVNNIKTTIQDGATLSEAMKKHPKYFDGLFCNLVAVGENAGILDKILTKITEYQEKVLSMKKKIKKALYYPVAVIVIALGVVAMLMIFVVPQFAEIFKGFGAELPPVTQMTIDISNGMQKYWWMILAVIIAFIYVFKLAYRNIIPFHYAIDSLKLKLPVFGDLIRKSIMARIIRTLSITLEAGIPLVDALNSMVKIADNMLYEDALVQTRDSVSTGQEFQAAISQTGMFPPMVTQMVAIAEQSGSMETILNKVATFYEEDVDAAVDALSSILEPIIIVVLGSIIALFVVAMYMPIFQIGSIV